jgi:phage shock protein C
MIAGVCGGLATYLGIDSVLVRLAFVVLLFASGIGFPIYMILWVIMPQEDDVSKSGSEIIQENIEEMGQTVSSGVSRIGRPGTVGILLILFGLYFLFGQMGWLSRANGIFWPLVIIGLGIYLLARRSQ